MQNNDINSGFFYLGADYLRKKIEKPWGYRGAFVNIQDH